MFKTEASANSSMFNRGKQDSKRRIGVALSSDRSHGVGSGGSESALSVRERFRLHAARIAAAKSARSDAAPLASTAPPSSMESQLNRNQEEPMDIL
jgi:hypothetical protein